MGWFSNYVSDPPGNADAIAGVRDGLSDAATNANAAENDLSSIKSSISTWLDKPATTTMRRAYEG